MYTNEKDESELTKFCLIGLDSHQIEQTKQVSKAVDRVNSEVTEAITVLSLLSSSDSSPIFMRAFKKMLQYVKKMDITSQFKYFKWQFRVKNDKKGVA